MRALDWLSALEGWRWVLAWVVASTVPGLALLLVLGPVVRWLQEFPVPASGAGWYLTILPQVGVTALIFSAAVAAAQSLLLRHDRVSSAWWIAGSALAATTATLTSVSVNRFVFQEPGNLAEMNARQQLFSLVSTVFTSLLVGGVQARVLSRSIERAWLWIPAGLVTAVSYRLLLSQFVQDGGRPPLFVLYGGLAPLYALVLGIVLRWLLTRDRSRRLVLAAGQRPRDQGPVEA